MKVTFLGTASCFPTPQRGVSCTALTLKDGQVWLFDAGEGTQVQLQKSQLKMGKITKIFITHLHGDHCFGLPGLLCTLGNGTNCDPEGTHRVVTVYGPLGIRKMICTALELSRSPLSFILDVVELVPDEEQYPEGWEDWGTDMTYSNERAAKQINVREKWKEVKATSDDKGDKYWEVFKTDDCDFIVRAGILKHRIPSFGYVVREKNSIGTLDVAKAKRLGLQPGPVFARLKSGHEVTTAQGRVITPREVTGPPIQGRKVVVMGDTSDSYGMAHLCTGADLLLHEATMEDSLKEKAVSFGHSTPTMAAEFALKTSVKRLCLFHLSPRYRPTTSFPASVKDGATEEDMASLEGQETGEKLRLEAQQVVDAAGSSCKVLVAEDFMVLELPTNKLSV